MRNTKFVWLSPLDRCDCCGKRFGASASATMYDAATITGPWANLCQPCFNRLGKGLGTGLGQRYELQTDGQGKTAWVGTAGFEGLNN